MVQLLDSLSGKWSVPILYRLILAKGPLCFGALKRCVGRITQKELTRHLRHFEALGLLVRVQYSEMPLRVEYHISEYGRSLRAPLTALAGWSARHGRQLFEARARIGSRAPNR
jgi:DNA-binding HxlR family transcriptional regulator